MSGSNLLVVVTGSIAAFKAGEVVSQLVQRGHRVRTVLTAAGERFLGAATLEGLTGFPVLTDLFAPGAALEHINLTRWADAVVVCPATANTVNRLAAGLGDDLLGSLFLAHDRRKPWLLVPAMNPAMWSHPATVAATSRLRSWGVRVMAPERGHTACGEEGEGRLPAPAAIVTAIEALVAAPVGPRRRVLVTAGGTSEPVDGVRVLTNVSTGATGAGIAATLAEHGHDVLLLRARHAVGTGGVGREETFGTFAELEAGLRRLLAGEKFDAVIHAAAVSDYHVAAIEHETPAETAAARNGKLPSGGRPVLRLAPNPRLVDQLRSWSAAPLQVFAFKLTHGADAPAAATAVKSLFAHAGADYVVHNDLAAQQPDGSFPAQIFRPDGTIAATCPDRATLAVELARLVEEGSGKR